MPGSRARATLFLLFVAASALPAADSGAALENAVREASRRAEEALAQRESQIAESNYRTLLYEGWLLKAALARESGHLDAARTAYERAAASAVETRRARISLARVLGEMDRPDDAEVVLRSLIVEDPADAEARRLLATTLGRAGRLDEAVQELEQLRLATPGDAENVYLLATAYLQQGRLEPADALLAEIAARLPTPQTWILIGRTYRDAELYERAREAFVRALELDPNVRRARYYLGTVHLLDGGVTALAAATEELERELLVHPDDEITNLYLGMARVELRRHAEAIPHLEIASRRDDLRADALRFLGRALLEAGRVEDAVDALRRGLDAARGGAEEPEDPPEFVARQISSLHYQLAQALRRGGDAETARVHFDAAKRYQARSAESARESLDRYLSSETTAAKTLELSPAGDSAAVPLAGADRRALADWVDESIARAYFNLGVLQVRAGAASRAADLLFLAAELTPDLPELQYSLGVALFNAERFAESTEPLERARARRPDDARLDQMLALAWLNSGAPEKAAAALAGISDRASNPGLEYAYGLALVRSGRAAEAEPIFLELLRQNADWPELNVVLGQAFAQQGNYPAAIESLRRALRLDPAVAEAHATLGEIHLRRGELERAEEELTAELRLHPEDDRSRYTLATVLDLGQKPGEAMVHLRTLLQRDPGLAKARYLLGKILLASGEAEQARDQLEAAAGLAPEDANIRYQLGQTYRALGHGDEARAQFEAYRALKRAADTGESR